MKRLIPILFSIVCLLGITKTAYASLLLAGGLTSDLKTLLLASKDNGQTWQEKINGSHNGLFGAVSCSDNAKPICMVLGIDDGLHIPIIASSNDGGDNWTTKTLFNLPAHSRLYSISCSGHGDQSICLAGGEVAIVDDDNVLKDFETILIQSKDGGNTWTKIVSLAIPKYGYIHSIQCKNNGVSNICIAAGAHYKDENDPYHPLILTSNNGGSTWSKAIINNEPDGRNELESVSCTGTNSNMFCTAGGYTYDILYDDQGRPYSRELPLVVVGSANSNTWDAKIVSDVSFGDDAQFYEVSCTGGNEHPMCAAVGERTEFENFEALPIVAVSQDLGITWDVKSIKNLPIELGQLFNVECIGKGEKAKCTAVGYSKNKNNPSYDIKPLLITSIDGGLTWLYQNIKNLSDANGPLWTVNCKESKDGNGTCIVGGGIPDTYLPPLFAMSTDGGVTWQAKNITNTPGALGAAHVSPKKLKVKSQNKNHSRQSLTTRDVW